MTVTDLYKIPVGVSLSVVGAILAVAIASSLLASWRDKSRALPAVGKTA